MQKPIRKQATVFPYRGKWRIQYLDHQGRSRTLTAETKQEAYFRLAEIEGQARRGFLSPMGKEMPTFSLWVDYWLEHKEKELSPITHLGYVATAKNYLKPAFGHIKLNHITARQIQGFYEHLQNSYKLKSGTIRKIHAMLSGMFGLAVRQGILLHSPVKSVVQPRLSHPSKTVLTEAQVNQVLNAASQKTPREHLRWILALKYGLRQGEALGLKFLDFDLANRTLQIIRTVNSLPGQGVVELEVKSRHSKRTLPIDSKVVQLVSQIQWGNAAAYIYEGASTMPVDATSDQRAWRNLLKESGVTQISLHGARHTAATLLINRGVNPRAVQMLLGHASPAYTMATYVHPTLDDLRQLIADNSNPHEVAKSGMQELGSNT